MQETNFAARLNPPTQSERIEAAKRSAVLRASASVAALVFMAAARESRDGTFGNLWIAPMLVLIYAAVGGIQYFVLRRGTESALETQRVLLHLDPMVLAVFICDGPRATAFMAPYLVIMSVPVGFRYGPFMFWSTWICMALTVPPILYFGNIFWRSQPLLLLTLTILALSVAAYFGPLLRRRTDQQEQEAEEFKSQALETAMVAKSAFLARVSHQLRSPLQAIVSSLELMQSPAQAAMRHRLVANISSSASRLSRELRDLLTIARAEAWQLHLEPSAFDANMLLESAATEILADSDNRSLEVFKVAADRSLFVMADSDKIVQILANIAKYVLEESKSDELTISVNAQGENSDAITFVLEDDGISAGPSEATDHAEAIEHGFGPDGRDELHDSLSLTLVKTLVAFLGGSLSISEKSPKGLKVGITIPCEFIEDSNDGEGEQASCKVMVVTDKEHVRKSVVASLDDWGYVVDCVSSVPVAANRLELRNYAIVLIDANLPRRNARRLAMEVKHSKGSSRESSVISFNALADTANSANTWPFDVILAGEFSMDKFLDATSVRPPGRAQN